MKTNKDGGFDLIVKVNNFRDIDTQVLCDAFIECDASIHPTDAGVLISLLSSEIVVSRLTSKTVVERVPFTRKNGKYRIMFHDQFLTVYYEDAWVYTFSFMYASHPENQNLLLRTNKGSTSKFTINYYTLTELSDWRESIYVDLESSPMSGVQSVIQQRPIEVITGEGGSVKFMYAPITRDSVTSSFIKIVEKQKNENQTACSDAIVYYSDVQVLTSVESAKKIGFVTRTYRLPDLTNGAIKAAGIMQKKSVEEMDITRIKCRPNLQVEPEDLFLYDKIVTGTNVHITGTIIVDSVELSISAEEKSKITTMSITGREVI